jgi:hypothetical protein
MATVLFDVSDPRIFRALLCVLGDVKQHIEPGEIRIHPDGGIDHRLRLLALDLVKGPDRAQEIAEKPVLLSANHRICSARLVI